MFTKLRHWLHTNCRRSCGRSAAPLKNSCTPRLETMEERLVPAFLAATDYGTRIGDAVVTADFNGDGKLDLASIAKFSKNSRGITVQFGNGSGGFSGSKNTTLSTYPQDMVAGDLNADGKVDLVTTYGDRVSVLLGKGIGLFQPPKNFTFTHPYSSSLAVADFDGDGKLDVAVTGVRREFLGQVDYVRGVIDVFKGDGKGSLALAQSHTLPRHLIYGDDGFGNAASTAVGDFNSDGRPDLAVSFRHYWDPYYTDGSVFTLMNAGGSLAAPTAVGVYGGLMLAVGDMNGDLRPDLVTKAGVSLGNGDGTFQTTILGALADLSDYENDLTLADFNGDGKLDVATTVGYYLGNGDGSVQPVSFYAPWTYSGANGGVAVGDFNGDGRPDLVGLAGDSGSHQLRVSLNDSNW